MSIPAGVDPEDLQYGYIPTFWICVLFVSLFAISTATHLGQAIRFRMWWLLPTVVLAGLGEIAGWAGRLWSSKTFLGNGEDPYLMQICATIISPTPLLAANFVILGMVIAYLGPQYSRLSPKWYTIIFCSADVVALIIQAIGGGMAASGSDSGSAGSADTGSNIMLAGIIFQTVSITVYVTFAAEFLYRYLTNRPFRKDDTSFRGSFDSRIKLMISGLSLSTLCLFIRAIYRTIELADGWDGRIIRTEVYFNVLDGAMIILAIYTINICHPGFLLGHIQDDRVFAKASQESSEDQLTLSQMDPSSRTWV